MMQNLKLFGKGDHSYFVRAGWRPWDSATAAVRKKQIVYYSSSDENKEK